MQFEIKLCNFYNRAKHRQTMLSTKAKLFPVVTGTDRLLYTIGFLDVLLMSKSGDRQTLFLYPAGEGEPPRFSVGSEFFGRAYLYKGPQSQLALHMESDGKVMLKDLEAVSECYARIRTLSPSL